ncbi:MAG: DNA-binding domain-containing protein [Candidatus Competibacteraceae bacterium]|jgi:hypothetical protein|nr:DNA-binding domain-containing protein [Candidatus Competibacteraceae bacterium]
MPSLRELQTEFSRAVFGNELSFGAYVRPDGGLNPEHRVGIYRNNTFANFTDALQLTYPVVQRLVGDEFFSYAAAHYIGQTPSTSGDLQEYGDTFPEFLRTFKPAASLPYLPDVASLEWAYEQVFYAAEPDPLDTLAMSRIPEERYGDLRFTLSPASRLLTSAYPVLRIWQVNQDGFAGDQSVDLDSGGNQLLIIRRHLQVELEPLTEGEYVLLQALSDQLDFTTACEQALAQQPDFNLPASFQRHVAQGTLTNFSL